jgi:hypothetical protein
MLGQNILLCIQLDPEIFNDKILAVLGILAHVIVEQLIDT